MEANRISVPNITETDCAVLDEEVEIIIPNTNPRNGRPTYINKSASQEMHDRESIADDSSFDYRPENYSTSQENFLVGELFSASYVQPVITFTGELPFAPKVSLYVSKHSLQKKPQEKLYNNLEAVNCSTHSIPIRDVKLIAKIGKPNTNILGKCPIKENYESDRNVSGSSLTRFRKDLNLPAKSPIKVKSQTGRNVSGSLLRELLTGSISHESE